MNHLDDEAELYALGMLDVAERERVDEHVRGCDACAQRLGRAEGAVAALVTATSARRSLRLPSWPVAVAAAFALTSGVLVQQNIALRAAENADGGVLDRLVRSHFVHAQFTTPDGAALDAKAIYERHGAWYTIVTAGDPGLRVTLVHTDGTREQIEQHFARRGPASLLTVEGPRDVRTIELDDPSGRAVGRVTPVLEADAH